MALSLWDQTHANKNPNSFGTMRNDVCMKKLNNGIPVGIKKTKFDSKN